MARAKPITAREARMHRGQAIGSAIDLMRHGPQYGHDVIELAARIEQYVLHGKTDKKPKS